MQNRFPINGASHVSGRTDSPLLELTISDKKLGETLGAWIIPSGNTLTADDVRGFCKERIAHFNVSTHVMFKDVLPMTVTVKPQKFVMCQETEMVLTQAEEETA
ncbi:hypothetical protein [Pukyongiella litopenaei]|uniref:Uncharacterized protein n=1 Tax=Pukyongiella litopenaei TaxID=2605946 RepID=A0A5C2H1K7_9RHOB|nr:hypothetical protein [Pukyongiella litopenaei]QEP30324.1 hypothetical protein C6Y53_19025 [Pukyongiella litopenaei]